MFSMGDLGIALPGGFSDRVVVQHVTEDGRMFLKLPPVMAADDPLLEPVINVAGACSWCKKYFSSEKLLYCSNCKTGGPYCGTVCQRQAWKSEHKKICKKSNEPKKADVVEKNTFKALQQLFAYADTEFIHHSMGFLSISDTARMHFVQDGPGALILHLKNGKDLEYFNMEVQNSLIGNRAPDFSGVQLPSMIYVQHPLKGRASYPSYHIVQSNTAQNGSFSTLTDVEDRLRALDIDSIMENLTLSQYLLGIVVGDNPALHLLTFEQNTTGIPKPDSLVSAASRSTKLIHNLVHSPEFAKCRQHMAKMNIMPGVLWIRNMFNDTNDFHRSELEKVTPDVLLKDLIQHNVHVATRAKKYDCACMYINEHSAVHQFGGEPPEWWNSFLEDNLHKIRDPHTLVGFFYVASFSNSETISCYDFSFHHD